MTRRTGPEGRTRRGRGRRRVQQPGGVVGERRRLGAGNDGLQDRGDEPDGVQSGGRPRVDAAAAWPTCRRASRRFSSSSSMSWAGTYAGLLHSSLTAPPPGRRHRCPRRELRSAPGRRPRCRPSRSGVSRTRKHRRGHLSPGGPATVGRTAPAPLGRVQSRTAPAARTSASACRASGPKPSPLPVSIHWS